MRIRQQAKLAGVSLSNGISSGDLSPSPIGLHCHLSQSPWDIIQIGRDYGFTPDGSSGESLGDIESVASMKISDTSGDMNVLYGNGKNVFKCGKTDGKSWKCKNEVAEGQTLCQHHLDQMKGYNASAHAIGAKKDKSVATGSTVATDRRKKKVTPVTDQEYYYYSGFGPCWGKHRGAKNGEDKQDDYIHDYGSDDEDEEGSEEVGKKRARKRIKARSLKSLM